LLSSRRSPTFVANQLASVAQLAEWPAVVTCGRTVEEAREMLLDAARELIASYRDEGRELPIGGGRGAGDDRSRGRVKRE
jgi:hypothetical protein